LSLGLGEDCWSGDRWAFFRAYIVPNSRGTSRYRGMGRGSVGVQRDSHEFHAWKYYHDQGFFHAIRVSMRFYHFTSSKSSCISQGHNSSTSISRSPNLEIVSYLQISGLTC